VERVVLNALAAAALPPIFVLPQRALEMQYWPSADDHRLGARRSTLGAGRSNALSLARSSRPKAAQRVNADGFSSIIDGRISFAMIS